MGSVRSNMVTSLFPTASVVGGGDPLGLFAVVVIATLVIVLVTKEIVSVGSEDRRLDPRLRFLSKTLNAPILAMLALFVVIVIVRAWQVL